jgi:hypothetical protein
MNKTLSNIFPENWKDNYVENLVDLLQADYNSLSDIEKDLRALAVNLVQSFERSPIITPSDLLSNIQSYRIIIPKNKWFIFALTRENNKYYIRAKGDKLKLSSSVFNYLPKPETLRSKILIPDNGKLIIVRGSNLDILSNKKAQQAFELLKKEFLVSDLAFYEDVDGLTHFYSVAAKSGKIGSNKVLFPNEKLLLNWSF